MDPAEIRVLIDHLETAAPGSAALSIARLQQTDDPVLLLIAALLGTSPERPLARATQLARTTRDRQLVAIGAAHLAGDHDRARGLVRDHRTEHPDHPILAWILANDGEGPYEIANPSGFASWLGSRDEPDNDEAVSPPDCDSPTDTAPHGSRLDDRPPGRP
jgi:hypothetical protein